MIKKKNQKIYHQSPFTIFVLLAGLIGLFIFRFFIFTPWLGIISAFLIIVGGGFQRLKWKRVYYNE